MPSQYRDSRPLFDNTTRVRSDGFRRASSAGFFGTNGALTPDLGAGESKNTWRPVRSDSAQPDALLRPWRDLAEVVGEVEDEHDLVADAAALEREGRVPGVRTRRLGV